MKNYEIIISKQALEDLDWIYEYIFNNSLSFYIADSFILELHHYVKNSLWYMPKMFPIYKNNVRKSVYPKNNNYTIFFEINESSLEVFILAITNSKQYSRYYKF